MGKIVAPCKDCPDRKLGCHSKCEKYKEYKLANDAHNKETRLSKMYRSDTYKGVIREYSIRKNNRREMVRKIDRENKGNK